MKTADILCIAHVILSIGCSSAAISSGSDSGSAQDVNDADATDAQNPTDAVTDGPQDGPIRSDAPEDGSVALDAQDEPLDAPASTIDSPFPGCSGGNPLGDGGSWCGLYDVATDGAIQDEAGRPTGLSVQEACTRGQPCTACLGGATFPGWCE